MIGDFVVGLGDKEGAVLAGYQEIGLILLVILKDAVNKEESIYESFKIFRLH